jgi:tRNA(Ile)-lysidine synthase
VLPQVLSTIARHNMLSSGRRVIAAVSGGPDSVCLLHILRELVPAALAGVAHFNHQLRGAESEEDEQFVSALAAAFHLPFHRASAAIGPGNLEQNARRARRAFFKGLIEQGSADRVALGHTRDDQAETVLFRLLRGSGLSGLAGILPVTAEGFIRPLLEIRREDVLAYLREHRTPWREDSSNRSPKFARNRIRHTLLPQLARDWNPQIGGTLAQLADLAYEEEVWWAAEIARHEPALIRGPGSVEFQAPPMAHLPRALLRRLIRHAIRLAKGDLTGIDYTHVEQVVALVRAESGSARVALPRLTAVRSFDWLLLSAPESRLPSDPLAISTPGTYLWPPSNPLIQLEISGPLLGAEPCDTLDLVLRGWRAGDQYQPLGHQSATKLKELFQKARVPSWRRASWPIVTYKGKILWAKEFGPSVDDFGEHAGLFVEEIPFPAESFNSK